MQLPDAPDPSSLPAAAAPSANTDTEIPAGLKVLPAAPKPSLARRITSRTTDLIAIGVVLVASLALGRQVLEWWNVDAPPVLDLGPAANAATEWGALGQPVELQFADSPVRLIRRTISGSKPTEAMEKVVEDCQQALLSATQPDQPPDARELELLQAIAEKKPDIEQPGSWQVHRLDGNMVMVVGVRLFQSDAHDGSNASKVTRRVICWGLIFPGLSHGSWTSYTFIRAANASQKAMASNGAVAPPDLGRLTLPAGCRRTLSVRGAGWDSLTGFQGAGTESEWEAHFSQVMSDWGWVEVEGWRHDNNSGWSASFQDQKEVATGNRILIQFQFNTAGQGSGVIQCLSGNQTQTTP